MVLADPGHQSIVAAAHRSVQSVRTYWAVPVEPVNASK
jgi:hypothetical protein